MTEKVVSCRYATLGDMLHASAAVHPDKSAVVCRDRIRLYSDLDRSSSRTANALIAAGLRFQGTIGILGRNSDLYVEILFGIVKVGGIAVLLNWRLAAPELRMIVADAGISVLFYDLEFAARIEALKPGLPPGIVLIAFDCEGQHNSAYEDFRQNCTDDSPAVAVAPTDIAILMYTSGTTGPAKGVPATHFAFLWGLEAGLTFGPACHALDSDINLLTTPLFHLAAIGWTLASLFAGSTLVILAKIEMPAIIAAIAQYRVTRATILPAMMPLLLESDAGGCDLSSLRHISYGASPIPEPLLARMLANFRCGFRQSYGMTEISTSATCLRPEDHFPGSTVLLSCGRAYPDVGIRILARDGSHCRTGETGEIALRTPSLFRGYWNRPDATAEAIKDGWYLTGDLGYLDSKGYLFLRDRKKDMIISGGENIFPVEVESALAGHPDVVRSAVIGVPSARWGEEVKAVIISRPGSDLSAEGLRAFLRPLIAGYKLPKSFDFVDELPLTPAGKVAKHALRERYWTGVERRIH
jgi:acyl-CoA synthetase (AMP-forming)/AMP-acid ligase II